MKNWTHMRILTKLTDVWNWKSVKKTLKNYQKRRDEKDSNENEMDKDSYENEIEKDSHENEIWIKVQMRMRLKTQNEISYEPY